MKRLNKLIAVFASAVMAVALAVPVLSFADASNTGGTDAVGSTESVGSVLGTPTLVPDLSVGEDAVEEEPVVPEGDCTVTVEYYENVTYEEPGIPPGEDNRYHLGTRVLTGFKEGDVLNAWDYVIKLPGFFFFDGWPGTLTVSSNPDENLIELFYFRLWSSSYTVNYYLLEGADLSADTWDEALEPEDVEFVKFGSEVFENQPYGELVEGDAYEYQIDGTYVVDAYPAEIRVGTDTDNSVINVLYVAASAVPPQGGGAGDGAGPGTGNPTTPSQPGGSGGGTSAPSNPGTPNAPSVTPPSAGDVPGSGDVIDPGSGDGAGGTPGTTLPGGSTGSGGAAAAPSRPAGTVTLPSDQTFNRDEMSAVLPNDAARQEASELFRDFINSERAEGEMEITDEMLADTVDPTQARLIRAAYDTGFEQGQAAAGEHAFSLVDHIVCIVIILVLLVLCIVAFWLYYRERRRNAELTKEAELVEPTSSTPLASSSEPGSAPAE